MYSNTMPTRLVELENAVSEREREREREREKENITSYLCMLDKYMMTIDGSIVTFQFLVGIRSRVVPSTVYIIITSQYVSNKRYKELISLYMYISAD